MTAPVGLPVVPAGTPLHLAPGEWSHCHHRAPQERIDLRVVRIHAERAHVTGGWVWVTGHAPECSYTTSDCTVPCMELLVLVSAIVRQMRGR